MLKTNSKRVVISIYLLFFLLFECIFLLYLNVTTTTIILTIAALVLLISFPAALFSYRIISAIVLLVYASFFRIYLMLPIVGIALPFLLPALRKKNIFRFLFTGLFSFFLICLQVVISPKLNENKYTDIRRFETIR